MTLLKDLIKRLVKSLNNIVNNCRNNECFNRYDFKERNTMTHIRTRSSVENVDI